MEPDLNITSVIGDAIREEREAVVKYLRWAADESERTHATAHPHLAFRWIANDIENGHHIGVDG